MVGPTIGDVIGQLASERPDAPALMARRYRPASYGFLVSKIEETRSFLNSKGIGRGDRIAVIVSDPDQAMTGYLAVTNSAVAVPMNPKATEFELERNFRELSLAGVLVSEECAHVSAIAAKFSLPLFWITKANDRVAGDFQLSADGTCKGTKAGRVRPDDIACIQTSSGTTGRAKCTLQSHEVLLYRTERDRRILGLGPEDVMINFRPPYLSGPLNIGLLGAVCSGGGVVVPTLFDADEFFEDLLKFGITWYTGGPVYHQAILERAAAHADAVASHKLRFIRSAGYSLPEDLEKRLEATFGVPCIQKYGSSEAGLVSCNPLPPGIRKVGTCGPVVDCEVRIVSDDEANLGVGEIGEIWVRGPGVFSGYGDDETTRAAFAGDWFKTGDLGSLDADGYLSISGRKNEIINRGGQKIDPHEVEMAYGSLPGVSDVLCFPIPHATLGATAGLAVVAATGVNLDIDELRLQGAAKLSRFKQPETILLTQHIPRGATGKPLRKQAAELLKVESRGDGNSPEGHAPRDRLEQIWAETLGLNSVHNQQNFTRLGGDSLRAVRLVLRIESAFDVSLPPDIVYDHGSTLGGIRLCLENASPPDHARAVFPRRSDPNADLPLTSSQARLWTVCKTFPDVALYNSSFGLRLPGQFDRKALEKALALTVSRHEALRAVFPDTGGRPCQRILPELSIRLEVTEVSSEVVDGLNRSVHEKAQKIARRPYDLASGPLVRHDVLLVPDGAILLHQMHHIIGDAISTSILAREIVQAYAAFKEGTTPVLSEITRSFGDFVEAQAARLSDTRKTELLDFWMKELEGVDTILEMPADHPRPKVMSHSGARVWMGFGNDVARGLRELAADHGTSTFVAALAAFEVLVHRLTAQQDFIIGTGIDTRPPEYRDQIVGFCLNTVPIPARLRPEMSFSELLAEVKTELLRAKEHAEAPLDGIVQRVSPNRRGSVLPLVQVLFGQMPRGTRPSDISSTEASLWNIDHDRARFDLTIMLDETDRGLGGFLEYSTDLFEPETIDLIIQRFRVLLEDIIANPDQTLTEFRVLPEKERARIESLSIGPRAEYPRDLGVAEIFTSVARETPEATAVVQGTRRVSYGELHDWSNAIACRLIEAGVGRGDIVGLSAERTPAAIAGLIGILKSGAAYLALDAKLPSARVAYMLKDAGAEVVLVQRDSALQIGEDVAVLSLDQEPAESGRQAQYEVGASGPRDLAYLCYTSGTTGVPKGVEVEQRSVLRLVLGADYAALGPDERICQTGALGFDASTFEVWGALLNGGTLVQPLQDRPSLSELADLIKREDVTTIWLTAGLFRQVVDYRPDCFRTVRQVLTGGDVVSADHVLKLKGAAPDCRVVNGYGPTENTTFSVCGELDVATVKSGVVPIGRPVANSSAYILDERKRLMPLGSEGDLYVGGDGVARGYRGQPELTREVFGPDICSGESGSRMYRTGDRARLRTDGRIEFLGRRDSQIKIRGFRVEVQEIEKVLRDHPGVKDTVVAALSEDGSPVALHAFFVPENELPPESPELKEYLGAFLPGYMIPSTFTGLDGLPLNQSGKIDHTALRELCSDILPGQKGGSKTLPRSKAEQMLAAIWSEVLSVKGEICVDDDFFDLGGDSLLTLRLGFRIKEETGRLLPQIDLFVNSVLHRMASLVETSLFDSETAGTVQAIWQEVLGAEPRSPNSSIFDEGGDSYLLAQLVRRLSDAFGFEIPIVEAFSEPTVLGLTKIVERTLGTTKGYQASEDATYNPVISLIDGSAGVPVEVAAGRDSFFFISGAGGHVLPFVPVARRIMAQWQGIGVLDPLFHPAAPSFTTIGEVAAILVENVQLADPDGPYLLVGYSYGGHVAFEMARQLHGKGLPVGLVILDSRCRSTGTRVRSHVRSAKSKIRTVLERLRLREPRIAAPKLDLRHDDVALREKATRARLANLQKGLVSQYVPRFCDIPLVFIRSAARTDERDGGWSRVARVVDVLDTSGNHLTLFKGEHEQGFAVVLDAALRRLRTDLGASTKGQGKDG